MKIHTQTDNGTLYQGDCLETLRWLPSESVNCGVTSPPYWGLRDYGVSGQLGQESTPEEYIGKLVEIFREFRRVLRDDGTLWLNLGDSYGKGKQLVGIPWRVALALQADGWYLRQDIIWHKPNPMPESVTDRCTKSHEYIFLLSKSPKYYYDHEAIKEESVTNGRCGGLYYKSTSKRKGSGLESSIPFIPKDKLRNKRSVWSVSTKPFKGAHFAVFPPDLIKPCILAGCPGGGVVFDPFFGAGTTGLVAIQLFRRFVGIELSEKYCSVAVKRLFG